MSELHNPYEQDALRFCEWDTSHYGTSYLPCGAPSYISSGILDTEGEDIPLCPQHTLEAAFALAPNLSN